MDTHNLLKGIQMKVRITDIPSIPQEILKFLETNKKIVVFHRGNVYDLQIDDHELALRLLEEYGVDLQ